MLRVLTLATLFPDASRPRLGAFVERQTLTLAGRAGVEVEVVAPRGLPPLAALFARYRALAAVPDEEVCEGVRVHRPRFTHWPGLSGRGDVAAIGRALIPVLTRLRTRFAFDVIDAQFFFPDGPAAIALGRHFGVPVSIKARGGDIHYWGSGQQRAAIVAAGRAADGMLAVSQALRDDMVALGMPGERITVHYTGIDHARFRVRDRAAAKGALGVTGPLVVGVGALVERKGHGIVIAALARLPGATLAIIGAGEHERALRAAAIAHGVADRVRFLGSLGHDAIADWLAAADVMALISASEGLANAWVEALASGTPVVIADVGGARELVDRPAAGRLVARDPAAVADAIVAILRAPPERDDVAATVARFSWEANAAALEAHLRSLQRA